MPVFKPEPAALDAIIQAYETRIGTQYTIDTLRVLQARFPGVHFVWIMGADSLASFHRWRGWTQIMAEAPVAVRKHLRWVNGENENNARCGGGVQTAKYAKYAKRTFAYWFAYFAWFAVHALASSPV